MTEKPSVKIIVATHKNYQMPKDDMYIPLLVGAEGKNDEKFELRYEKDNTGENISLLNSSFCELTGLYWAWKNLESDYIGLVHYRRHFSMKKKNKNLFDLVLTYDELAPYLGSIRVFVPQKRKYYIETLYSHYQHTHYIEQLDITREIIAEKYPQYVSSFDEVVRHRYGYMFNMMIMDRRLLNEYCEWLFDILFELKRKVDFSGFSPFQGRFLGRISEIIFNVWLDFQIKSGKLDKKRIKEIPYIHMEKINWLNKGFAFLKAKFIGKKYEGSF